MGKVLDIYKPKNEFRERSIFAESDKFCDKGKSD